MKTLMLALYLFLGGFVVNAQIRDSTQKEKAITSAVQDRQPIQASELPDPVKTSLQSQDFAGWSIAQVYRGTHTDTNDETKSMEVFFVELRNGAEVKTAKFDRDGNNMERDR